MGSTGFALRLKVSAFTRFKLDTIRKRKPPVYLYLMLAFPALT